MKNSDIYRKHPHIMADSIEEVPRGKKVMCGKDDYIISHGKVCIIKCSYADTFKHCLKTRMINVQDAGQVKQCRACVRYMRNVRRRQKRG